MTPAVRSWFMPTTAVALGVLLLFHPQSDGRMYDGLSGQVVRWLVVAIGLACFAAAAVLVDRARTRPAPTVAAPQPPEAMVGARVTAGNPVMIVGGVVKRRGLRPSRRRRARRGRVMTTQFVPSIPVAVGPDSARRTDMACQRPAFRHGLSLVVPLVVTFLLGAALTAPVTRGQTPTGVALTLPPPSVSTPIGTRSLHLVDRSRRDPFAAGRRDRELMVQLWYPAARATPSPPGAYMPAGTARVIESVTGVPPGAFGALRVHAVPSAPAARGRHPVVIFSPGFAVPRGLATLLVEDLAARGYVVVALDHTHDALAVQFPGGRVETGNLPQNRRTARRALAVRVADVRFVLRRLSAMQRRGRFEGRLNLARVGMVGHSLGGATAAATMLVERRVRAGILLDGTVLGAVVQRGLTRPFMIMNSAGAFARDANRRAFWAHLRGPRFNFDLAGSGHYAFTDLAALTPQFAPNIPPALATTFTIGQISAERAVPAVRAYVRAFFDRFLRSRPAPLLDAPSSTYPEVRPIR